MALKNKYKITLIILIILIISFITLAGNYGLFVFHGPPGSIELIRKSRFTLQKIIVTSDSYFAEINTKKSDMFTYLIVVNSRMKDDGLYEIFDRGELKTFATSLLKDLGRIKK